MTDHIIKAALEADFSEHDIRGIESQKFAAFYSIAYRAGMERAAEIADEADKYNRFISREIATAIRAHAQNQPKNEHDTDDM